MAESMRRGGLRAPVRALLWGGAACLLLAPWLAMHFTAEVNWTALDFVVFGSMLAVACASCELAARANSGLAYRAGAGVAVAAAFLLLWANLAVGVVGEPGHPANLLQEACWRC